jgi:acetyl esterase/lipase
VLSRPATPPDETVVYGSEPEQLADVRFGGDRASRRPLIVLIHGGFWRPTIDRAHTGPMAVALAEAGWTVAAIEYRRVPQHPNLTIDDVGVAVKTLPAKIRRHDGRVLVMGHSAGGHLTLWAASKRPNPQLMGALALGPAADLRLAHELGLGDGAALLFLGEDAENRADIDPKRMPSPVMSVTIVHGDEDDVVPIALAESYVMTHAKTRLVKVHGAGHFAVIDPLSRVWPLVVEELEEVTQRSANGVLPRGTESASATSAGRHGRCTPCRRPSWSPAGS